MNMRYFLSQVLQHEQGLVEESGVGDNEQPEVSETAAVLCFQGLSKTEGMNSLIFLSQAVT